MVGNLYQSLRVAKWKPKLSILLERRICKWLHLWLNPSCSCCCWRSVSLLRWERNRFSRLLSSVAGWLSLANSTPTADVRCGELWRRWNLEKAAGGEWKADVTVGCPVLVCTLAKQWSMWQFGSGGTNWTQLSTESRRLVADFLEPPTDSDFWLVAKHESSQLHGLTIAVACAISHLDWWLICSRRWRGEVKTQKIPLICS